jgi:ABC-type dipeptide/oligopeptide/nickel transport system ATPase subunit
MRENSTLPTMDVVEVLKIADGLMFDSTSKYLDDLQRSIVQGVYEGKKYSKIADESHCTEGHVTDVAATLWKILSDAVGEKVTKSNLKSTIERYQFSIVSSHYWKVGNVNFCSEPTKSNLAEHESDLEANDNLVKVKKDVGNIPDLFPFYGRNSELNQLKQWVVTEHSRIVTIFGMSGIGKTALVRQLLEEIEDEFDRVIWLNLGCQRSIVEFMDKDLLPSLAPDLKIDSNLDVAAKISLSIEYLQRQRYLIILDDFHRLFSNGQLAGTYAEGCEDYGLLFKRIKESNHQSCVLLLSWDKPREIDILEGKSKLVQTLQLNSLGESAREILKDKGLTEESKWTDLINHYQGNPLWLKIVATMVKDLFSGRVGELAKYETLILPDDLRSILNSQFDRLSELEKQVMLSISNQPQPVSISQLIESTQISPPDLFNVLQSLGRRALIEKQESATGTLFSLQIILKKFMDC